MIDKNKTTHIMVSFKEFVKNPIIGLLFMALGAVGYLYYDIKSNLENQVEVLQEEVQELQDDNKKLNEKFIQTLTELNNFKHDN